MKFTSKGFSVEHVGRLVFRCLVQVVAAEKNAEDPGVYDPVRSVFLRSVLTVAQPCPRYDLLHQVRAWLSACDDPEVLAMGEEVAKHAIESLEAARLGTAPTTPMPPPVIN